MTWIHRLTSVFHHFLAIQLRELVRLRTESTLHRLDDRLLDDIGVPRNRIAQFAREAAHKTVPVPPMPDSGQSNALAQLRSWWVRRAAIRELLALDDRLLRDIGIEPGQVGEVVDAMLSRHRDLGATRPMVQHSDVTREILAPSRRRPRVPAMAFSDLRTRMRNGNRATISAERRADVHALRERATNEGQSSERGHRTAAGL